MTYTYQVTEVHLLKNSLRTVAARTALLDRVPSGATNSAATGKVIGKFYDGRISLAGQRRTPQSAAANLRRSCNTVLQRPPRAVWKGARVDPSRAVRGGEWVLKVVSCPILGRTTGGWWPTSPW